MRFRLLAFPLLTAIFVPAAGAVASSGGIGVRLVDVPTSTHDPLARSYIVGTFAPGTTVRRRVEIRNSTRAPADVVVYPGAAGFRRGNFSFASGRTRNELSAWTSVSRSAVRLQPGTSVPETVTINVPKSASPGERYAVIWAVVSGPASAGGGVTLVNRVGVRMYVSIGPGGAPRASFAIGALTAERSAAAEPLVVAKVSNSGRQTLAITGSLTLSNGQAGFAPVPFPSRFGPRSNRAARSWRVFCSTGDSQAALGMRSSGSRAGRSSGTPPRPSRSRPTPPLRDQMLRALCSVAG